MLYTLSLIAVILVGLVLIGFGIALIFRDYIIKEFNPEGIMLLLIGLYVQHWIFFDVIPNLY